MKQLMFVILTISMLSCGASKTVRQSKQVIKGDWYLKSITYNQSGTFNVKLLSDASKECFEGSTWQFIPNNNTGTYNITSAGCSTGKRFFVFTIQEIDETAGLYDFLLKPTNEKGKSETNNSGFRLQLKKLSDSDMQLQQTLSVEGSPFKINMNFIKTEE